MNDDFENGIDSGIDEAAQAAGRFAGNQAGKGLKKLGKKAAEAIGRVLLSTLKAILPYILVPLLVIGLAFLAYLLVFEYVGIEKSYTKTSQNELELGEDGLYHLKEGGMSKENQEIQDYYKFMAGQSYSISVGSSNQVYNPDDEEVRGIKDYYNREEEYNLSPDLLFALDEIVYRWDFKYSEQFTKPVAYNKDTFDLLPLIDKEGYVKVESNEENIETGEKTGNKILSVRDYGLGSILKFNEKQTYQAVEKIKGEYIAQDVWDGEKVVKQNISPQSFETILGTEDIYLIDRVVLFTGNIDYEYEKKDLKTENLKTGISTSEKDKVTAILYDIYYEEIYEDQVFINPETKKEIVKSVYVETITHNLYKYRSQDSAVYRNVPVVTNASVKNDDIAYLRSYLTNFEAYVPTDVIQDFSFNSRIDYDSRVFDYDSLIKEDYAIAIGSKKDTEAAIYARNYFPLIQTHAKDFGVDPYVILAILTEKAISKTASDNNGIMGIEENNVSVTARKATGELELLSLSASEKAIDDNKSIRWSVMVFKNLLDEMNGNVYKAIQAYDFGTTGLRIIEEMHPEAWNSQYGWLIYRESARRQITSPGEASRNYSCMAFPEGTLPVNGIQPTKNACYLEDVLQYYAGSEIKKATVQSESAWSKLADLGKSFLGFVVQREKGVLVPKFEFENYMSEENLMLVIGMAKALKEEIPLSSAMATSAATLNFWDKGYMESINSVGLSLQELTDIAPNPDGYLPPIDMAGKIITSNFGWRSNPFDTSRGIQFHNGVDISAYTGTPLYAVADGEVTFSGFWLDGGNVVIIKHKNGAESLYMHLSYLGVKAGQLVSGGDQIGKVGSTGWSTGPHLHFAFKVNGNYVDGLGIVLGR